MADKGEVDLYYGDETRISQKGYCPYGYQYYDEDVWVPSMRRGAEINLFGLWSRQQDFRFSMTEANITSEFVIGQLDDLSWEINRMTVVILDNASAHKSKKLRAMIPAWQDRGLFLYYLPPYSPQLNPIEWLWKQIKQSFLRPQDYRHADGLRYRTYLICTEIGKGIRFNLRH